MSRSALHLFLFGLILPTFGSVDYIAATGNPHVIPNVERLQAGECNEDAPWLLTGAGCPAQVISPFDIDFQMKRVQEDTFIRLARIKLHGLPVPVYHFKQPGRISPLELPFRILPLRSIDLQGIIEIPVDAESSNDSWFPDYRWSIIVCQRCAGMAHLGWHFTHKLMPSDSFYALIVDHGNTEDANKQAPIQSLNIGIQAPSWMAVLASTIHRAHAQKS